MTDTAIASPTCDARVGELPSDFGMAPLWCGTTRGLTRYTDTNGVERRYCGAYKHGDIVRFRYPVKTTSPLRDICVVCRDDIRDDLYILVNVGAGVGPVCATCQAHAE